MSNPSAHTAHLRKKSWCYSEKKIPYFLSLPPPGSSWSGAAGLWLLSIRSCSGSGQQVEPGSCCPLLEEPSKSPLEISAEPPPGFVTQTHVPVLNGGYHPRAIEATSCHGELRGLSRTCLAPSSCGVRDHSSEVKRWGSNVISLFFFLAFNECNNTSTVVIRGSLWQKDHKIGIW